MLDDSRRRSGASAEPVLPSDGKANVEAKAVSAAGERSPRPGWRSVMVTAAKARATNLPEGAERSLMFIRGLCA